MPKLDENDPKSVAAMQDPSHPLVQEIERLREENAALRGSQVIDGKFAGEAPKYKLTIADDGEVKVESVETETAVA